MTRTDATRVVVCAGGLGTRIASWARYIPKEFYPVDGRPGIVHLLEEIAALGPAEVVIVCHPYYDAFTSWARAALSQDGHDSYRHAARLPAAALPLAALTVSFITQDGPYADITSVLNGAGYLGPHKHLYVAFADNLYRGDNPLLALQAAPPGCPAVLARPYQPELAASRGVIATRHHQGRLLMLDLSRKARTRCGPRPRTAIRHQEPAAAGGPGPAHRWLHPLRPRLPDASRHRTEAGTGHRCLRPHSPGRRDHDQQPGHRSRDDEPAGSRSRLRPGHYSKKGHERKNLTS